MAWYATPFRQIEHLAWRCAIFNRWRNVSGETMNLHLTSGLPAGMKRACLLPMLAIRPVLPPGKWTSGARISTTGLSAIRRVLPCLTARHTPEARSSSGLVEMKSSSSEQPSHCCGGLSVHYEGDEDETFVRALPLIERAATDERNFVKKAVNMALRATGKRNRALNAAALDVARRLAASPVPAARWVGSHAFRELTSPAVAKRIGSKSGRS